MRLKTLNGAPLQHQLDFGEDKLLTIEENSNFSDSLKKENPSITGSEQILAKWRRLDSRGTRLRSGWSQPHLPDGHMHEAGFHFSEPTIDNLEGASELPEQTSLLNDTLLDGGSFTENDDFLHHSLVLHDGMVSSQLAVEPSQLSTDELDNTISSSSFLSTSFNTVTTQASNAGNATQEGPILQLPPKLAVTPLGSLPSARHLRSIYPQTPTPTFICVVTAKVEVREILVRKGDYKMELREVTVADNTNPSFKVSFWFRPFRTRDKEQENLRRILSELTVGDIVLLRNIVLSHFRDNVFGQSLNPNISKARTTVEVLISADGTPKYRKISPEILKEQLITVKRWARVHVVPDYEVSRKRRVDMEGGMRRSKMPNKRWGLDDDGLPPDTLESV
jgi:hypothetical protein